MPQRAQLSGMLSFPSLASYEEYRERIRDDVECLAAFEFADRTGCIESYDRSFMRPLFE